MLRWVSGSSRSGEIRRFDPRRRVPTLPRWATRPLLATAGGVATAGVAVLALTLLGRPGVRLTSSQAALAAVRLSGLGTRVTRLRATADGRPVGVTDRAGAAWPTGHLPAGATVHVTATAAAPSWLRWLFGSPVTAAATVRTPNPAPARRVSLASASHRAAVRFTAPVTEVTYSIAGGPDRQIRFARPTTVADIPVPASDDAGTILLTATSRRWERPTAQHTVSWFAAPRNGPPAVFASPTPGGTAPTAWTPITLTFSEPVSTVLGRTRPTLTPTVPGHWTLRGTHTLVFTPSGFGYGPGTQVTVRLGRPVSLIGTPGAATSTVSAVTTSSYTFSAAPGSVLRMQQILAQLGYLPVTFTPAKGTREPTTMTAEEATVYHPLPGSFSWRWSGLPATLTSQWTPGQATPMVKGALMQFEAVQNIYDYTVENETVDQMATASVWTKLLTAALHDQRDTYPYSYVYVTQRLPETLTLWENGKIVLTSPANTGIPQAPTANGTYPIYLRYTFQIMRGTNPDGSHYADPVYWINYFNGSDAVHGFVRASYGFPQSLGCVELPVPTAKKVFPMLAIGDLVTVTG